MAMLYLLPLLIVYLRQTSVMLSEKETKIRETMSIMGMSMSTYYFTWFIRYFIVYVIIHAIGSFIIKTAWTYISYIIPFVVFILFDILLIIQSFFIQIFFTRSKIGVVIALLFFLLQYIISIVASNSNNPSLYMNTFISFSPHAAYILTFETLLYAESTQKNITFT
jgi:ATP-binding cassette subfamily A (ABC1) protein 3